MTKISKIYILLSCLVLFFVLDFGISFGLRKGLDRYFGLDQNSEILLIGHSHLMLATDKKMLEDSLHVKVSKYCREGVGVDVREYMISHYLSLPNKDSLKTVIYGVDQYMFNNNDLSSNPYKLFYPFMDNQAIDSFIKQNAESKDYWQHKIIKTSGYTDGLINSAMRGWMKNWSNYKVGRVNIKKIRKEKSGRKITIDPKLKEDFERTIELLTSRGIDVVLLNTPIIKEYNDYEPEKRKEVIDYLRKLADSSDKIYYWDLNPKYEDQYQYFFDPIHINNEGQPMITKEIIELYQQEFRKNGIKSDIHRPL